MRDIEGRSEPAAPLAGVTLAGVTEVNGDLVLNRGTLQVDAASATAGFAVQAADGNLCLVAAP